MISKYQKKGAGLHGFLEGIGMVLLFSIAMIFFMITFINSNNPNNQVLQDQQINASLNKFRAAGGNLEAISNNASEQLNTDFPSLDYVFLLFQNAFYIPRSFLAFISNSVTGVFTFLFVNLFGPVDPSNPFGIIMGIIGGIMIVGVVLIIMRAIRTGDER